MPDRLAYRPQEAADVMGVSRQTIYRAMERGELRGRKLGRSTVILAKDLEQWATELR